MSQSTNHTHNQNSDGSYHCYACLKEGATDYDADADGFTRGTIPADERIASRKLAQGSTNPKDNAPSNFWTLVEISQLSPKAKTALEQYVTLARIDEAKHYCDEGHYHDKKRDIAMLPSERVEELERLQRDSQPSPYTEALKEHLQEHGCGTGDFKSPQYVGGFIHCEVAKELYKKSKDEPDFKPPTGDSQKGERKTP